MRTVLVLIPIDKHTDTLCHSLVHLSLLSEGSSPNFEICCGSNIKISSTEQIPNWNFKVTLLPYGGTYSLPRTSIASKMNWHESAIFQGFMHNIDISNSPFPCIRVRQLPFFVSLLPSLSLISGVLHLHSQANTYFLFPEAKRVS